VEAEDRGVIAFLRSAPDANALVVANLGLAAVRAPSLTLATGPLCGELIAEALLGTTEVSTPIVSPAGGFEDYVPVEELGPGEVIAIDLAAR
jgi:hypothetical protein